MIRMFLALLLGLMLAAAIRPEPARADDQDTIDYRRHIMKTLNEQSAAVGQILSRAVPDDNAVAHLEVIALTAKTALKAFEPKVQGGESKPEIWTNWTDFSKRMNDFVQNSEKVAKLGRDQGKDAALQIVLDALPCKSCHDVYRNEAKK